MIVKDEQASRTVIAECDGVTAKYSSTYEWSNPINSCIHNGGNFIDLYVRNNSTDIQLEVIPHAGTFGYGEIPRISVAGYNVEESERIIEWMRHTVKQFKAILEVYDAI